MSALRWSLDKGEEAHSTERGYGAEDLGCGKHMHVSGTGERREMIVNRIRRGLGNEMFAATFVPLNEGELTRCGASLACVGADR